MVFTISDHGFNRNNAPGVRKPYTRTECVKCEFSVARALKEIESRSSVYYVSIKTHQVHWMVE